MTGPSMTKEALVRIQRDDRFAETRELLRQLDSLIENLDTEDQGRVLKASDLSLAVHIDQEDRADGPYVNHPLKVALGLAERFGVVHADFLIAALLHDSVEDQPQALIESLGGQVAAGSSLESQALSALVETFGERPASMVGRLSNPDFDEMVIQAQMSGDSREKGELVPEFYKQHFLEIFEQDPEAFLIKLADFSENAFSLSSVEEGARKDWFIGKYGPVILAVAEKLEQLPSGHLLEPFSSELKKELLDVYQRDYLPKT